MKPAAPVTRMRIARESSARAPAFFAALAASRHCLTASSALSTSVRSGSRCLARSRYGLRLVAAAELEQRVAEVVVRVALGEVARSRASQRRDGLLEQRQRLRVAPLFISAHAWSLSWCGPAAAGVGGGVDCVVVGSVVGGRGRRGRLRSSSAWSRRESSSALPSASTATVAGARAGACAPCFEPSGSITASTTPAAARAPRIAATSGQSGPRPRAYAGRATGASRRRRLGRSRDDARRPGLAVERRPERTDELGAGRVAILGLLGEASRKDGVEPGGQSTVLARRGNRRAHVCSRLRGRRLALEGPLARQQLVRDGGEPVTVARGSRALAARLLGRDVARGPEHRARARQRRHPRGARDPEVRDVDLVLRVEQQVAGLHVAVDDALRRARDRARCAACSSQRERDGRRRRSRVRSRCSSEPPLMYSITMYGCSADSPTS